MKAVNLAGKPFGMTSLYDAIAETAQAAADRPTGIARVLVITDGIDTGSKRTAPEVSGIAARLTCLSTC